MACLDRWDDEDLKERQERWERVARRETKGRLELQSLEKTVPPDKKANQG